MMLPVPTPFETKCAAEMSEAAQEVMFSRCNEEALNPCTILREMMSLLVFMCLDSDMSTEGVAELREGLLKVAEECRYEDGILR
jgi:hypothetical protein